MSAQLSNSLAAAALCSFVTYCSTAVIAKRTKQIQLLRVITAGVLVSELGFHLLPQLFKQKNGFLNLLGFFALGLVVEGNVLHTITKTPVAINFLLDFIHNTGDGIAIFSAFGSSASGGLSASIAIILHEAMQETADAVILLQAGLSTKQAQLINFICSLGCALGVFVSFFSSRLLLTKDDSFKELLTAFTVYGYLLLLLGGIMEPLGLSRHHSDSHSHITEKKTNQGVYYTQPLLYRAVFFVVIIGHRIIEQLFLPCPCHNHGH